MEQPRVSPAQAWVAQSGRAVCLPAVFQAVKAIVRSGAISDETRGMLKGWLKTNDCLLMLLSLTVIHAIALNAGTLLRTHLAGERWMPRLEKLLQRPFTPGVGRALAQVLLDWAFLFRHEELGQKSHAVLAQSAKHRSLLDTIATSHQQRTAGGAGPSEQATAVAEELAMGMPPVGPRRPPDLVAMYLGEDGKALLAQPTAINGRSCSVTTQQDRSSAGKQLSTSSLQPRPQHVPDSALAMLQPHDDTPLSGLAILTASVDTTVEAIRVHAAQLQNHVAATRKDLQEGGGRVAALMTAGYVAAQRCHICRGWVQKLAQTLHDDMAVSRLLAAIDVINNALGAWQALTSKQVFEALGITTPLLGSGRSAAPVTASSRSSLRRVTSTASAGSGPAHGQDSSTDLLGLNELLGDLAGQQDSQHSLPSAALRSTASQRARAAVSLMARGGSQTVTSSHEPSRRISGAGDGVKRGAVEAALAAVSGTGGSRPGPASGPRAAPLAATARSVNPFEGIDAASAVSAGSGGQMVNPFDDLLTPPVSSSKLATQPLASPTVSPPALGRTSDAGASQVRHSEVPERSLDLMIVNARQGDARVPWRPPSMPSSPPGRALQPDSSIRSSSMGRTAEAPSAPPLPEAFGSGEVAIAAVAAERGGQLCQQPVSSSRLSQSGQGKAHEQQPLARQQRPQQQQQQQQQQQTGWEAFNSTSQPSSPRRPAMAVPAAITQQERNATVGQEPNPQLQPSQTEHQHQPPRVPEPGTQTYTLPMMTTPAIDAACLKLLQQHGQCSTCHAQSQGLHDAVLQLQQLVASMQAEHAAALQAQSLTHQAEVQSIKATSIQKFKELMAQQQQQQPQLQPHRHHESVQLQRPASMPFDAPHTHAATHTPTTPAVLYPLYPAVPAAAPLYPSVPAVGAVPKYMHHMGLGGGDHLNMPGPGQRAMLAQTASGDSLL